MAPIAHRAIGGRDRNDERGYDSTFLYSLPVCTRRTPMTAAKQVRTISPDDEAALLSAIDKWVERSLKPEMVREYDHEDKYPAHIVEEMKELGLFGATVSQDYGG